MKKKWKRLLQEQEGWPMELAKAGTLVYMRMSAFYWIQFFGLGAMYPLLPLYFGRIGITGSALGILIAAGPVVSMIAQPMWGLLCDRYNARRPVLLLNLVVSAVVANLYPYAHTFWACLLITGTLALFSSIVIPIADSIALAGAKQYHYEYGNVRLWGALGFAGAVWVAGVLAGAVGIAVIFWLFAASFLLCAFLALGMKHDGAPLFHPVWKGFRQLVRTREYVLFLGVGFFVFGAINANNYFFSLLFQHVGGTVAGIGISFLLSAGSEAPFMKMTGSFIKKWGIWNVLALSVIVGALRWFLLGVGWSPGWLTGMFILQGLATGLFLPTAVQFVRRVSPEGMQVTALGVYAALANNLGSVVSSALGGVVLDRLGIRAVYFLFGVMTLTGAVLLAVLVKYRKKVLC
jgi:PPP family 3-phenylpropionic acid transporter